MRMRNLTGVACALSLGLALAACNQNKPTETDLPTEAGETIPAVPIATTSPGAADIANEDLQARGTGAAAVMPEVEPNTSTLR